MGNATKLFAVCHLSPTPTATATDTGCPPAGSSTMHITVFCPDIHACLGESAHLAKKNISKPTNLHTFLFSLFYAIHFSTRCLLESIQFRVLADGTNTNTDTQISHNIDSISLGPICQNKKCVETKKTKKWTLKWFIGTLLV